jgi:hypothetical protein
MIWIIVSSYFAGLVLSPIALGLMGEKPEDLDNVGAVILWPITVTTMIVVSIYMALVALGNWVKNGPHH